MKSAMGLTGSGSRDWVLQRLSAIVLAAYTVAVLGWLLCHGSAEYDAWVGYMTTTPMKVFSILAVLALAVHAWVGMWTVLTDYVTTRQMGEVATGLRIVFQFAMILAIIIFTTWGIRIFW